MIEEQMQKNARGKNIWEMVIMSKQTVGDAYYGETADNYFEKRKVERVWQYEQSIVEALLTEVPDGAAVLDLPFGTGRFVDFYRAKNMKIYGLEISKDMIEAAKRVLGNSFSYCEVAAGDGARRLPYADNSFDLIVCFRFLKFFPYNKAKDILREFYRVSKSKVIISMKLRKPGEPALGPIEQLEKIGENIYESDAIQLFEEAGFRVENRIRIGKPEKWLKRTEENIFDKINRHFRSGTIISALFNTIPLTKTPQPKSKIKSKSKPTRPNKERVAYLLKKV